MTAPTLTQILDASRIYALRSAIIATLAANMPCTVEAHPGRLDMDDVLGETRLFATPSLNVAVTRIEPAEGRSSGLRDVPVQVAVYIVTADQALGDRGLVKRDELALALSDALLVLIENDDITRWGLQPGADGSGADIGPPEGVEAMPLFTSKAQERGAAYYAVTWRQVLYSIGTQIWDFETPVPAGYAPQADFQDAPAAPQGVPPL